ncbi:MAG: hypothetical protein F9K32_17125 [Desulfobulbaceae bacterium]|nr:MAG: hypothetical protein F9K32_17125 [Desulfobulbaceae bacterium]
MNAPASTDRLIADIRHNCDISDARDHGIYSMCTMVLKLRGLYKWEKGLQPWEEPESADLVDWIEAKENFWATIAGQDYRQLAVNGGQLDPLAVEEINAGLDSSLHYGAGFGRSMKVVFFLAEKLAGRIVEGCPVVILGSEQAREMASPFAMAQDGLIIIRREALRFFLWDQVQEVRSSCRNPLRHVLQSYGLLRDGALDQQRFRESLDTIVDQEMDLFIHHEVGEILQSDLPSATLRRIIDRFPGSVLEFVGRAVKDILADTHPQGLLAWVIRERRPSSLSLYLSFFDGLREKLFPELPKAWQRFAIDGDWRHIEAARSACRLRNREVGQRIDEAVRMIGEADDEAILAFFSARILAPLGLAAAKTA